jgi:hypothetical protein
LSLEQRGTLLYTSDGWVLVLIAQPSSATAQVGTTGTYAIYKCLPGGKVRYHGNIQLPVNFTLASTVWNPAAILEPGKILFSHPSTSFDTARATYYRRSTFIEFPIL